MLLLSVPLLLAAWSAPARDSVSAAVAFLAAQQTEGNTWSPDTPREKADTLAAIMALDAEGGAAAQMAALRAKGSLLLKLPADAVTTLDLVLACICGANAAKDNLLATRNPDGGWGTARDQQSDILDTSLAADCLTALNAAPTDGWDLTAGFLVRARHADGYWYLSDEPARGQLELTARVVRTLRTLRSSQVSNPAALDPAISGGLALLRNSFRADGRFSLSADLTAPASPIETAELYLALIDQAALYADALSLLVSLQQADGRWTEPGRPEQDIYTTATVMMAFFPVKAPPASARKRSGPASGGTVAQP